MSPPSVGSKTLPILEGSERGTVEWFRVFPHGATLLVPSGSLQPPTSLKGSIYEHLGGAGQEESTVLCKYYRARDCHREPLGSGLQFGTPSLVIIV